MIFSVERQKLLDAVSKLQRVVGAKTSMPVLEGILISAEQGKVTLISYNLEMGMKRELTPEERLEQLEKEKEMLQKQIENQAKYDEMRKAGDDLALAMKAIQDSGFSREEAMQIFTITMMGNMIPPFLRR